MGLTGLILTLLVSLQFQNVRVFDTPNDAGKSLTVTWTVTGNTKDVTGVIIYRSTKKEGPFEKVKEIPGYTSKFQDSGLKDHTPYYYKIALVTPEGVIESGVVGPGIAKPQWFHKGRLNILIGVLLYAMILLYFIRSARQGKELYLRPIPGIEAVDEAIGRATEMGRPILFVPGLSTIIDVATIAALNILSHVTKKAGEYETKIIVPNRNPVVYTVAREIVKEAYTSIGRPDLFDPDQVFYVTDSQFGYAAAVSGIMVREKPAANFFQGMFYAESLILAETGASTGAVQIAGTDAVTQLPFFITACDYTLIGEELYAASAYLSREPLLVATLKGQDWMKFVIGLTIVVGSIFGLLGSKLILGIF